VKVKRRARVAAVLVAAVAVVGAVIATLHEAEAQKIDPRRPTVFVVGAPPGASPMQRVDARRTGASKTPLPAGTLRIPWRKTTGLTIDQPALSGADGALAIVSVRGDVTFLDDAGEERATVKVGAAQVGPAAMTSDGTVVYATSAGDVIGVRRFQPIPRFTTRIGGDRNVRAAPLALDDGGVVIATLTDLVVLDSEGNVRSRVSLPEPPDAPLLATGDKVLAITRTGAVFGWTPGREPVRLGSFSAPVDGGAVLVDGGLLVAVIEGNHLAEVDVSRGGRSTRSIAPQGLYLGPPATRTGNAAAPTTTLLSFTHSREFVVTLDAAGQELLRAPIASFSPTPLPDGGVPPLVAPPHTGTLVDSRGTIAFAATDGRVGVVTPEGAVESLGEVLCAKGVRSGVVGLTPFGKGAFAVTCDGGIIARVTGANAGGTEKTSPENGRGADSAESLRKPPPSTSAGPPRGLRPDPRGPSGD
jgi:hypothetical protein